MGKLGLEKPAPPKSSAGRTEVKWLQDPAAHSPLQPVLGTQAKGGPEPQV